MTMMMMRLILALLAAAAFSPFLCEALDIGRVKQLAARNNVSCILVFGDSSVDPGNNNNLDTSFKGNFLPYGKDFFGGRPTGRCTDGRLATDFIADALGYTKVISGFLDPKLTKVNMLHGISFASAASGYDDLTANLSQVLSISKQVEYFVKYKNQLRILVGEKAAEGIIKNAVFLTSMGTNDFLQNYFLEPIRPKQFSIQEYQDYLVSRMSAHIKVLHKLGASRLVVVGVLPLGCMPLVRTMRDSTSCVESMNNVALSFNSKAQKKLSYLKATLGIKIGFVDVYGIIQKAVDNPKQYGLTETSKGCCGSGTIEYGETCKGLTTCEDPAKYVFWDAVHPTQKIYKILADYALEVVAGRLF